MSELEGCFLGQPGRLLFILQSPARMPRWQQSCGPPECLCPPLGHPMALFRSLPPILDCEFLKRSLCPVLFIRGSPESNPVPEQGFLMHGQPNSICRGRSLNSRAPLELLDSFTSCLAPHPTLCKGDRMIEEAFVSTVSCLQTVVGRLSQKGLTLAPGERR